MSAWGNDWRMPSIAPRIRMKHLSHPGSRQQPPRRAVCRAIGMSIALAAALALATAPAVASGDRCAAPANLLRLADPLPHLAARLAAGKSVTIVALGSSSTYGTGASRPEFTYPSRLAALLSAHYPGSTITVLNRGVGGEVVEETSARIERDVLSAKPDLVIWQIGTNDVLRDLDPERLMTSVRSGIATIHRGGADIILMDLQYAPAVLSHPSYRVMEQALWATAKASGVSLFRRFALMREWAERGSMKMSAMVAADRLHMTDESYDCLARQLSSSIEHDTHIEAGVRTPRG
jgi:acyl-CoA thioesterase I